MPATELKLDCTSTVNDIIVRHPSTVAVFNRFGLDTCCGSGVTVEEAAHREGVDAEALCAALHEAVRPS